MLREGWGVLSGHQWGHDLAIRGDFYMAMDNYPGPEAKSSAAELVPEIAAPISGCGP